MEERHGERGTRFAIRYRAAGKRWYETLDVTTRSAAEDYLASVRNAIREGNWRPPTPAAIDEPVEEPSFHEYATAWVRQRQYEVAERTVEDWTWALSCHLLEFFEGYRPSQITGRLVKDYKTQKVASGSRSKRRTHARSVSRSGGWETARSTRR